RRPVRRGGHAAGGDRSPVAGPVPVLPDGRPAGTGLPAAGVRAGPLCAAFDTGAPPGRAAGLDTAPASAVRRAVGRAGHGEGGRRPGRPPHSPDAPRYTRTHTGPSGPFPPHGALR